MITLNYDIGTDTAKLSAQGVIKTSGDVPVRLIFSADPGDVTLIELLLAKDADGPGTLAFTDDFAEENATTWTALLDGSDSRLVGHLANKGSAGVLLELTVLRNGARLVLPNLNLTVQAAKNVGPQTSDGGPSYFTDTQVNAAIAAAVPRHFSAAIANGADSVAVAFSPAFSGVPKLGGAVVVKAAAGDTEIAVMGAYGLSATGVNFTLSGDAPLGTYVLHCSAKL